MELRGSAYGYVQATTGLAPGPMCEQAALVPAIPRGHLAKGLAQGCPLLQPRCSSRFSGPGGVNCLGMGPRLEGDAEQNGQKDVS
jgi:hypothetical protein